MINILVVDDNKKLLNEIKEYFINSNDINVNTIQDATKIVETLKKNKIDILVLDLVMPKIDGINVLIELKGLNITVKTIILSSCSNDYIVKELFSYNVDYYLLKPFDIKTLEEKIKYIYNKPKSIYPYTNNENKIINILHKLGIPPNLKGYQYIKEAILICINIIGEINITKDIYPVLAKKYKCSHESVERAIRHAIEVGWLRNNLEETNYLFKNIISLEKGKPTNTELIVTLSNKISEV